MTELSDDLDVRLRRLIDDAARPVGVDELRCGPSGERRLARRLVLVGAAAVTAVGLIVAGAIWTEQDSGVTTGSAADSSQGSESNEDGEDSPSSPGPLVGEVGPNGGVVYSNFEMDSTPASLYSNQESAGSTVVFDAVDHPATSGYYVGAERFGQNLCINLSLAGKGGPIASACDIPAYSRHADVTGQHSFARVTEVVLDGTPTRLVYGVTYLDAAAVAVDGDPITVRPETGLPFWMHRFFAMPVSDGTNGVRLLDADGRELARVSIEDGN